MKKRVRQLLTLGLIGFAWAGCGDDTKSGSKNAPGEFEICGVNQRVFFGTCVPCAKGEQSEAGADASGDDTTCTPVTCQTNEYVQANACIACPAGTTNEAGDLASGEDTTCATASNLCKVNERVLSNECFPCSDTEARPAGDDPTGGNTSCSSALCKPNEYVKDNTCVMCPAGTSNLAGDNSRGEDTECDPILCQANQRVLDNTCVDCSDNTRSPLGSPANGPNTECIKASCDENERVQSNLCEPCPAGSTNAAGDLTNGPDSQCDAVTCQANERVQSNLCVSCAAGTTNAAGDDASGANTTCDAVVCRADERVLNNTCSACVVGTSNAAGDDASGADTQCDAVLCGTNERVLSNTCSPCPAGTTNAAGDDASGTNTQCDAVLCGANERVQSNQCVVCSSGTSNAAGDDASGPDTQCDAQLCSSNQRVQSNACVACPAGTTNAAGDDASGTDTTCDPTLCGTDERVQSNQCVACLINEENDAGDDASGADTMCDMIDPCLLALGVACVDFNQAYLKRDASTSGAFTNFGDALAMSGDTLVVGVQQDNKTATDSGAVYVFVRNGSTWSQQAYIKSPFLRQDARFGWSVAIEGDTLVIGAPYDTTAVSGRLESGVVYIYERTMNSWNIKTRLIAPNSSAGDLFGSKVAISNNTIVVGAPREDSNALGIGGNQSNNSNNDSGALYVFTNTMGTWQFQEYIKAMKANTSLFGDYSVALENDTIVAGGLREVYTYTRTGTVWSHSNTLTLPQGLFSASVTLQGNTLALGLSLEDSGVQGTGGTPTGAGATNSGAVYVYTRSGTSWSQQAYIKASNAEAGDQFGSWIMLNGDLLAVSAVSEDGGSRGVNGDESSNTASNSGAAYLFERNGTVWTQKAYIKAPNSDAGDNFGRDLVLSGNTLVIGAFGEDSNATGINGNQSDNTMFSSGAAYVFKVAP